MKRKLIETYQENLIVCDNPICDFVIKSTTNDINEDISEYINIPCPKCGQNLLTKDDYIQSVNVVKTINFINKWFKWLLFFIPKNKKRFDATVHIQDKKTFIKIND